MKIYILQYVYPNSREDIIRAYFNRVKADGECIALNKINRMKVKKDDINAPYYHIIECEIE